MPKPTAAPKDAKRDQPKHIRVKATRGDEIKAHGVWFLAPSPQVYTSR